MTKEARPSRDPTRHCWRKTGKQNIGLDFPISIENWLNLSTTAHMTRIIFVTAKLSQRRATKFILEN